MRLYYTFRFKYNNQLGNDRTTPSEIFRVGYPEFATSVSFNDLSWDDYLKYTSWERFGYVDVDEQTLWQYGYTLADVQEELVNNNQIKVYLKDKVKARDWLRLMTTFREKTDNVFVIQEASEFNEELLLDLN